MKTIIRLIAVLFLLPVGYAVQAETMACGLGITICTLTGEAGNDTLYGGSNSFNFLYGKAGNDKLYGGSKNDYLNGHAGDDYLYGKAGDDILYGNWGNDWLDGGAGDDIMTGAYGRTPCTEIPAMTN